MKANKDKQDVTGRFVNNEVHANVNEMVEYILQTEDNNAPFQVDDIDNIFIYPEYRGTFTEFNGGQEFDRNEELERLEGLKKQWEQTTIEENPQINDMLEDLDCEIYDLEHLEEEAQEILEWWLVTPFLANKLYEHGEPVILSENLWGRTCSGQAILLDGVIEDICNELNLF